MQSCGVFVVISWAVPEGGEANNDDWSPRWLSAPTKQYKIKAREENNFCSQ